MKITSLSGKAIGLMVTLFLQLTLSWDQGRAQDALNLEQAIQIALREHPSLKRAEHTVEAAEARVRQAKSAFYPQIGAAGLAKQGLSGASASALGVKGLVASPLYRDIGASGNLFQNLFDFGRTRHNVDTHKLMADSLRESTREQKAKVILDVEQAYYSALQAERLVTVAEKTIVQRKLIDRQAEVFYRAGLKSKLDMDLARINLSQAELELLKARNALQAAFATLNNAMGVEAPSIYRLEDPAIKIESPRQLDELMRIALQKHPGLQASEVQIQALEEIVKRAQSNLRPKLMAFWSSGYVRFSQLTLGRLMVGAFGFDLPILTGGYLKGEVEEAQAVLAQAKARRRELEQTIRLELERAHTGLINEIEAVKTNEQLVKQAQEAIKLAQARYKVQLGSFLELAQAELVLTNFETNHARALYNFKMAEATLQYAAGELGK